jgi:hypothetical protein
VLAALYWAASTFLFAQRIANSSQLKPATAVRIYAPKVANSCELAFHFLGC